MTELPELPPVERRTRPLPPGGLDAVMAGGRRRRQRVMAMTSGATTALAVAVAAVLVLPGNGGQDELQFAEPEPTPSAVAPPGPQESTETPEPPSEPTVLPTQIPGVSPAPAPSGSAPVVVAPQGGPTAGGGPVRPGPGQAAAPPAADRPAPAPARPVAERPAYVEDTDEDAAGAAGCRPATMMGGTTPGAPDGTGSTTTGGGCTYSSGFSTGEVVRRGSQAQVVLGYCAAQGGEDDVWEFAGGQEKDVLAVAQNGGQEVFRFSSTVRYVQGAHEVRLRPGRCVQWTGRWALVTTDGRPVPAGTYRVSMTVRADRYLPAYQQPRGFEETVTATVRVVD